MAKKDNTFRNIAIAGIALFFLWPRKSTAGSLVPGGGYTGLGNGYEPTAGFEGSLNESYLGITPTGINRGIRNNNPGNIKFYTVNNWQGKIPMLQNTDAIDPNDGEPTFEQFESYPYGIRALIYLIKIKYIPNGHNTLFKILDRYDPGFNQSYLNHLVNRVGISENTVILESDEQTIKKIIQAIARFENGQVPLSEPEVITDLQYQTARSIL